MASTDPPSDRSPSLLAVVPAAVVPVVAAVAGGADGTAAGLSAGATEDEVDVTRGGPTWPIGTGTRRRDGPPMC